MQRREKLIVEERKKNMSSLSSFEARERIKPNTLLISTKTFIFRFFLNINVENKNLFFYAKIRCQEVR